MKWTLLNICCLKGVDVLDPKELRVLLGSCFKVFIFFLAHHSCWNIEPSSNNIIKKIINHLFHKNMFLISVSFTKKNWHFPKRWHFWPFGQDLQWWLETSCLRIGILNYVQGSNIDLWRAIFLLYIIICISLISDLHWLM